MTSGLSPAVLLVFSIVTAGYILAATCYRFRYLTAREAGHRLYLTCATLGSILTFLSGLLASILNGAIFCASAIWGWPEYILSWEGMLLLICVLNIMLAIAISRIYNRRQGVKSRNLKRAWQKDDFSSLLDYATHRKKLVSITLSNRKVYIGLVARTNEPHWDSAYITLLPFYSGYRDEKAMRLQLKNTYDEVFDYFVCKETGKETSFEVEDFYVVMPLSEIVSAHIFNPEIFDRLQRESIPETIMSRNYGPLV